ALLHAEIEIEQIDIEIRINEPFLDVFPNDPGHLVAVHFDDRIGDFDLLHWNFDLCGAEGVKTAGRGRLHKTKPPPRGGRLYDPLGGPGKTPTRYPRQREGGSRNKSAETAG